MSTQTVTIHGSGFMGPGFETGPMVIHVGPTNGPTNVTDIVIVSDAIITCKFPEKDPDWPHKVDLWITNPHGVGHHPGVFEYSPPRPLTIFSIDPPYGLYTGHESVVIIGQGFLGEGLVVPVTHVQFLYFGEITDLTEIEVISDTEIHANTPAGVENRQVGLRVFSSAAVVYLGIANHDAFKYALPDLFGAMDNSGGSWTGGQTATMRRLPGQGLFNHLVTAFVQQHGGTEYEIDFIVVDNNTITFVLPNANTAGVDPITDGGVIAINFKNAGDQIKEKGYWVYRPLRIFGVTDPVPAADLGEIDLDGWAFDTITNVTIFDNDSMTSFDVTGSLVIDGENNAHVTAPDLTGIVHARIVVTGIFEDGFGDVETASQDFTVYSGFEPVVASSDPLHGPYSVNTDITIGGANFAVNTPLACDSLDSSFQSDVLAMYMGSPTQSVAQAFSVLDGNTLSTASFFLAQSGTPTGNVFAKLYAFDVGTTYGTDGVPTPTILATSDPIDVTTLSAGPALVNAVFTFSGINRYRLDPALHYVIAVEYTDGNVTHCVNVGTDTTISDHDGNGASFDGAMWTPGAYDTIFAVVTQGWAYEVRLVADGGGPGVLDAFTVDSDSQITATVPIGLIDWADGRQYAIKVTSQYGDGTSDIGAGVYWKYDGPPTLVDQTPHTGSVFGGTLCTLTVDDTTGCTGADSDGIPMTGFTIIDGTTIQAFRPAHAAGAVDTHVTNAAGTSSAGAGFTYV